MKSMGADSSGRGQRVQWSIATLAILIAACATGDRSAAGPGPTAGVEALIGDAACDSDSQCHTIGVGAKACGGPQQYLAWSSQRTDGTALQSAAERDSRIARGKAQSSGVMSNCALVTDPGAYCSAPEGGGRDVASTAAGPASAGRRCRLRTPGSGGAGKIY